MKTIEQDVKLLSKISHVEQMQRLLDAMPKPSELDGDDNLMRSDVHQELKEAKHGVFKWYNDKHIKGE